MAAPAAQLLTEEQAEALFLVGSLPGLPTSLHSFGNAAPSPASTMKNPFRRAGGASRQELADLTTSSVEEQIQDDFLRTVIFLILAGTAGFVALGIGQTWPHSFSSATLWAMACVTAGAVIGFLFGIPRVLQLDAQTIRDSAPDGEGKSDAPTVPFAYRMQVNTNLEQISDWLTKIIVGVGLIELRRAPDLLDRAATFVAQGVGAGASARVVAASLIVYFTLLGFLGGYLITRLFLAGAFSRADQGAQNYRILERRQDQQLTLFTDLVQTQIATKALNDVQPQATFTPKKVHRILWVDDNPNNNATMVDVLRKMGIHVTLARSTAEGLAALGEGSYDRIITDLGRREAGGYNEKAGIDLVREIHNRDITTPIVVHSSVSAIEKYGDEAIQAGARSATPSTTRLLQALDLE